MSRYYDYSNAISWQNQSLGVGGVGGAGSGAPSQKDGGRSVGAPPLYHPAYSAVARGGSLYPQPTYHGYKGQPVAAMPTYPVLPDVRLKKLPFYDVLAEILKPSSLLPTTAQRIQEAMFPFYLSPQQATDVATGRDIVGAGNKLENIVQVQLRFCLVETSCEQEDCFPSNCAVKVNGKICPLPNPVPTNKPNVEPKRPPRPVNITSLLKLSPTVANTVTVSWATDFPRNYAVSVTLVRKLTSPQLLARLKSKGTKHPDYTRSLIKEKLREDLDSEIATTSLRVSLVCPLGKTRMSCPCRPSTCPHLQCFDASLFLQMNERKPTWTCPVCDRPAPYDDLVVDGYFREVLESPRLGSDCCEVQLHEDGSWSAHLHKREEEKSVRPAAETKRIEVISDDPEVIPLGDGDAAAKRSASTPEPPSAAAQDGQVVDLTSDSDDDGPPRRKTPKRAGADSASSGVRHRYAGVPETAYSEPYGVSSSGYRSPAPAPGSAGPSPIISLDSPSPPPRTSPPPPAHQASLPRAALWAGLQQHY